MSIVNGKIPAGQVCPYRDQCLSARDERCNHMAVEHLVPYSCGTARMFQLIVKSADTGHNMQYNTHIATH